MSWTQTSTFYLLASFGAKMKQFTTTSLHLEFYSNLYFTFIYSITHSNLPCISFLLSDFAFALSFTYLLVYTDSRPSLYGHKCTIKIICSLLPFNTQKNLFSKVTEHKEQLSSKKCHLCYAILFKPWSVICCQCRHTKG